MSQSLKAYIMPIAMLLGILFHSQVVSLRFILPYAICIMLFFTYSSIDFKQIRIRKLHIVLIICQLSLTLLGYFTLNIFSPTLSQAFLLVLIMPVASASAIITSMLGGNLESMTTYNILNNIVVAIVAPIFFAIPNHSNLDEFFTMSILIAKRISPLLFGPLVFAFLCNVFFPTIQIEIKKYKNIPFYIWSLTLIVAIGMTMNSIKSSELSISFLLAIVALSLISCILLFFLGRRIGGKLGDSIVGGQGLGQKNTLLGIWMALSFFSTPSIALAPGVYIIWQNLINSYQLWNAQKKLKK